MKSIQDLLKHFTASPYHIDIPDEFLAQFFADRKTITTITRDHFDAKGQAAGATMGDILLFDGTDIFGQSTIEENFALHSIIHALKPREVLEVGLFRGQTATTLNRALQQSGGGNYTGIDISTDTVEIVQCVLKSANLHDHAKIQLADSKEVIANIPRVDFAFIDGDHEWDAVVRDVVGVYNKLESGGVIALHDTGTHGWGWFMQDPGHLLHKALPNVVAGQAELYWLDSMCRQLTMRLLSPSASGAYRYFTDFGESLEKARVTTFDTIRGWGGMGFILKLDGAHQIDVSALLSMRPPPNEILHPPMPKSKSILGRIGRKSPKRFPNGKPCCRSTANEER